MNNNVLRSALTIFSGCSAIVLKPFLTGLGVLPMQTPTGSEYIASMANIIDGLMHLIAVAGGLIVVVGFIQLIGACVKSCFGDSETTPVKTFQFDQSGRICFPDEAQNDIEKQKEDVKNEASKEERKPEKQADTEKLSTAEPLKRLKVATLECSNCGANLHYNDKYCQYCGAEFVIK